MFDLLMILAVGFIVLVVGFALRLIPILIVGATAVSWFGILIGREDTLTWVIAIAGTVLSLAMLIFSGPRRVEYYW